MIKTIRILFIAFGIVGPILIGGLHTWTHFTQLITPEVQQFLSTDLLINGEVQTYWDAWGIMSFMMGITMIALGLANAAFFFSRSKSMLPPVASILVMIGFLSCVVYAGITFQQTPQLMAGTVGLVAMGIGLLLRLRIKETSSPATSRSA